MGGERLRGLTWTVWSGARERHPLVRKGCEKRVLLHPDWVGMAYGIKGGDEEVGVHPLGRG